MGSNCSQIVLENNVVKQEQKYEINNLIQNETTYIPTFSTKLKLNVKIDKVLQPYITTERNQQESQQQNQQISKKYFDKKMTINKSYNPGINILSDLCPYEVASIPQKKQKKQKNVEELDQDYDQMCQNDLDQFKFQQPAVMKYIDKRSQQYYKITTFEQRNLRK
ncbi:unnamed protein product [Paramecium sonneborni]|uniref:Uncharacterized protein n=1 Tax=Paramecium sonneborni TaxID=65129 RepID=A0A8S1LGM9_9CILI|nr:unnamed protein product [Paramecium sonneborni]